MTSSTELSARIARVFGITEATALLHMRIVREAGILTQGGRGRSSARMTSRDAANLLIAVAGASAVKDSVKPLSYQAQTWVKHGTWEETLSVPELLALPLDHRFSDAVTALVDSAVSGTLEDLASHLFGGPCDLTGDAAQPFVVNITIAEPQSDAFIEVVELILDENGQTDVGERRRVQYGSRKKMPGGKLKYDPPLDIQTHGDLSHHHTFTHRAIQEIGNLLRRTE
ncbi:hypothetical protein [Roseixanthobacter pseudopolyaromaticivorans]|uniref:hypothetical protein n=1 Tax=Xanthobacteraceae TaxID=335928 RepID=UPI00372B31F0